MAISIPSRKSEIPTLAIVRKVLRLLRSELLKVKGTYFHMVISKASQAGGLPPVKPKRPKITQKSSISFSRVVKKARLLPCLNVRFLKLLGNCCQPWRNLDPNRLILGKTDPPFLIIGVRRPRGCIVVISSVSLPSERFGPINQTSENPTALAIHSLSRSPRTVHS